MTMERRALHLNITLKVFEELILRDEKASEFYLYSDLPKIGQEETLGAPSYLRTSHNNRQRTVVTFLRVCLVLALACKPCSSILIVLHSHTLTLSGMLHTVILKSLNSHERKRDKGGKFYNKLIDPPSRWRRPPVSTKFGDDICHRRRQVRLRFALLVFSYAQTNDFV